MQFRFITFTLFTIMMLASATPVCEAQKRPETGGNSNHNSFFSKLFKKEAKPYESRDVTRAKREQEKKEAKIDKEYEKYVADSRKRAYDIQSPEVQERMIQNEKDIKAREKAKRKKNNSATKRGANKYR